MAKFRYPDPLEPPGPVRQRPVVTLPFDPRAETPPEPAEPSPATTPPPKPAVSIATPRS